MKKSLLVSVLGVVMVLGLLIGACAGGTQAPAAGEKWPSNISIGTAPSGTGLYTQSVGMAVMMQKYLGIATAPEAIGASDAVLSAMLGGKVELGQTQGVSINDAYLGTEAWKKEPLDSRLIVGGPAGAIIVYTDSDSGLVNFEDMRGKKVSCQGPGSVVAQEGFGYLLKAHGMTLADIKPVKYTSQTAQVEDIDNKAADVAVNGHSALTASPAWLERESKKPLRWLRMEQAKLDSAAAMSQGRFPTYTFPGGVYKLHPQPIPTLGYSTCIIAQPNVPESLVYAVLKMIWDEHLAEFNAIYEVNKLYTVENTVKMGELIPFHPGTIKYIKEKGLWNKTLEEKQDKLLKAFGSARKK